MGRYEPLVHYIIEKFRIIGRKSIRKRTVGGGLQELRDVFVRFVYDKQR